MLIPELVQVGDIFSYRFKSDDLVGQAIGFFSNGGKYSHTSGCSELQKENGLFSIIESHIDTGVVEKDLNTKWYEMIDVFRYKSPLTDLEKKHLISYLRDFELGKGYDEGAFPSAFVKGVVSQIFGLRILAKCPPLLNDNAHRFCTEVWEAAYWNALHIQLNPGIDYHSVNPSLLTRGDVVRIS